MQTDSGPWWPICFTDSVPLASWKHFCRHVHFTGWCIARSRYEDRNSIPVRSVCWEHMSWAFSKSTCRRVFERTQQYWGWLLKSVLMDRVTGWDWTKCQQNMESNQVQEIRESCTSSWRELADLVHARVPERTKLRVTSVGPAFLVVFTAAMNMYSLLGSCTLGRYFCKKSQKRGLASVLPHLHSWGRGYLFLLFSISLLKQYMTVL